MTHAGLMLYGTLSSYQPGKAMLLTDRLIKLVLRLLDPDVDVSPFLRENATTVLGNLCSHAPNTVILITRHPELLTHLISLLEHDEGDRFGKLFLILSSFLLYYCF